MINYFGVSGYPSYQDYGKIASGKALSSVSDGPSQFAIAQKENIQIEGLNAGSRNAAAAKDMLGVSDSALGSVNTYLSEIRVLALQAQNTAIYSSSDIAAMQGQVEQYKKGIADIAGYTQFNYSMNLLDGSRGAFSIATDPNGGSVSVSAGNATLEALGIADFDLRGDYSIDTIDNAISMVNTARGIGGAQTNSLEYLLGYNAQASYNQTAAKSQGEDLDLPKAISKMKQGRVMQTYQMMMQRNQMEQTARATEMFFTDLKQTA